MRFLTIQRILAGVVALSSLLMVGPIVISLWLDDGYAAIYGDSLIAALALGTVLWIPARQAEQELRVRDGFVVVTLGWVLVSLVAALPFCWGASDMSYVRALFEAASGLTTTGATMLSGIDSLPKSLLFYRQSLCFFGGMGIVILAVAILPAFRIGGSQLFRAEVSGPVKDHRLTPRLAETARALWRMYLGLNVVCALAYWGAGMSLFDAICHAFSTIATGGFSTHDQSFAHFHSALIQVMATVFMFLGGINFSLHFVAFHRGSLNGYLQDAEVRAYARLVLAAAVLVAVALWMNEIHTRFPKALREGLFISVSFLTTTGFTTTDIGAWTGFVPLFLVLLAFVGGCSGSTAGGIKIARALMLFRQGAREVIQLVHPRGRFLVKLGGINVPGSVLAAVTGFCTLYVLCFVVLTLAVSATGLDPVTAASAVAACLNNLGVGLGEVSQTFAAVNETASLLLTFAMILGRLEVFTLLVLLTPEFWRE